MIRWLHLLRLKFRAWMLHSEYLHACDLLADHERRMQVLWVELKKVRGHIGMLEKSDVLLTQIMRRAGK